MKSFFGLLALAITMVFTSCSDESKLPISEEPFNNRLKAKVIITENEMNIFELMEFKIAEVDDFSINELKSYYDSIVWKVEGQEGQFKVSEDSKFVYRWSNHFFLPGEYKSYLVGYKENQLFYSDTVTSKILNYRDFLGYYWSDIEGSVGHSVGYINVLMSKNYLFRTFQDMNDDIPSVTYSLYDTKEEYEKHKEILYEQLVALYGEPQGNVYNNKNTLDTLWGLFHYQKENATPIYIWLTSTSRISLLKCQDDQYNYSYYEVFAEASYNQ